MKKLLIREYVPEDYPEIRKLWIAAGLLLTLSDEPDELHRILEKHPELCLVAQIENRLAGTVMGSFDGRRGYIHHLAVSPEYQGEGIGSRLLQVLENRYRAMNVVKIHLFIETVNAGVENYYLKQGWDRRDDLIMMSKTLRRTT